MEKRAVALENLPIGGFFRSASLEKPTLPMARSTNSKAAMSNTVSAVVTTEA